MGYKYNPRIQCCCWRHRNLLVKVELKEEEEKMENEKEKKDGKKQFTVHGCEDK